MVLEETSRRSSVGMVLAFVFLIVILLVTDLLVIFLNFDLSGGEMGEADDRENVVEEVVVDDDALDDETQEEVLPPVQDTLKINFQPVIDEFVATSGGKVGVVIYDVELDKIVGSYDADEKFQTASLYKLFPVYEGYLRVATGEWDGDEIIVNGKTVLECLDLAIRESNSPCAESLHRLIGYDMMDEIVASKFGINNLSVRSLLATPTQILDMMKIYYRHSEISDDVLVSRMLDSFLNQPRTIYNWRQGLPSGFSENVAVYNKVGWDYRIDEENEEGEVIRGHWEIYNDAAIVDFVEDEREFIIIVMTNNVPYQKIRTFATNFENYYNESKNSAFSSGVSD